ncbi:MAG TPA: PQQ-binding-like beta-propeller repeat protein [Gaiellaceae bacterium]|nr:PQQ-binding-like beta-propeller repeat protein [Gaiellaceae bacterium]
MPNADLQNTRAVSSPITSTNVSKLRVAWTIPLTHAGGFGYYANTPVVGPDGTIYFQDLGYNVFAANGKTGKVLWTHLFPRGGSMPTGEGPNGVAFVNGALYGETPTYAFALSAATGKLLWRTPNLAAKQGQGFNIAPQVHDGRVYLSTSGQVNGGLAYALDAKTGKVLWRFQETKNPADRSAGGALGTGGAWNTPAIGPDGTVYMGIANPYRSIDQATDHPTQLLYNDSTVALTPSGQLKWFYQAIPNDFHDWDMQVSPIYTETGGQPVIVDSGKMGYVYVMNAKTGKLVWKTPVGKHNGHDNDAVLALQHKFHPTVPYVYYPGTLGGVETNMALSDGVVYVPVNDLSSEFKTKSEKIGTNAPFGQGTGEMVALKVATGKVLWDRHLPHSAYGDATVTNDLVFTTTLDGKVIAFKRGNGAVVWQKQLPAGTNSPVSISGNTLITVASFPMGNGQKPEIVAYSLNAPAGGAKTQTGSSSGSGSTGSGTTTTSTSTKANAIQVQAGEFFFRLSAKSVAKPGTVTFAVKNVGHVEHDFRINGKQTPLIQPGQTANLVVSFKKSGKYPYLCTVPGHAAAGMAGVFTVG